MKKKCKTCIHRGVPCKIGSDKECATPIKFNKYERDYMVGVDPRSLEYSWANF